jgi:hypothetical protein
VRLNLVVAIDLDFVVVLGAGGHRHGENCKNGQENENGKR